MKRSASLFLILLTGCAQYAFAQQAGDGLNEQQRLGRQIVAQSCGVCHLPPARNAKTYGPVLSKAAGGGDIGFQSVSAPPVPVLSPRPHATIAE